MRIRLERPFEEDIGYLFLWVGARLDEVFGLSRGCSHCGMVEHAEMSIGFNYDDWIIIEATWIGIKGRCTSRVRKPGGVRRHLCEWWIPKGFNSSVWDKLDLELRFVRMNLVMIEGRRPCITLVSDNLYIVREIVSMDVSWVEAWESTWRILGDWISLTRSR